MPLGARHLCPACLGSGRRLELVPRRVCWSRVTLLAGMLPLVLILATWPFLVFSGLATIFLGFWTWKKQGSLVHGPQHWAAIVGILGGLAQVGVLGGIIYLVVWLIRHG
jgi:hypothetical protein